MTQIPDTLRYTAEHEWIDGATPATIGITAVATVALGDLVYLELPAVGDTVTAGAVIGEVESTKSVSELYSPVTGTVAEVNQAAIDDPSIIAADPYGEGWLLRVTVDSEGELMSPAEYTALAGE